jgi:hypothetical protein
VVINRIAFTGGCTVTNSPPTSTVRAKAKINGIEFEYNKDGGGRPTGLKVALSLGKAETTATAKCPPSTRAFDYPVAFDEEYVVRALVATGAIPRDPEADPDLPIDVRQGWEFVPTPFRARFFKEKGESSQGGNYFAQIDLLLTHTPK